MKKAKAKENVKANAKAKVTYAPFEVADYLDSEEAIAEYLSLAARDENPGVLLKALGDVAKARGMAEVAKASGLGRESLYKTLAPGAKPRFETIATIMRALNVGFSVESRLPARAKSKLKQRRRRARLRKPITSSLPAAFAPRPATPESAFARRSHPW